MSIQYTARIVKASHEPPTPVVASSVRYWAHVVEMRFSTVIGGTMGVKPNRGPLYDEMMIEVVPAPVLSHVTVYKIGSSWFMLRPIEEYDATIDPCEEVAE